MLKWIILAIFIASALYIQQRGKVRHSFYRQFFDHSTILAPINYLMYLFSKVPNQPYIDTGPHGFNRTVNTSIVLIVPAISESLQAILEHECFGVF